MHQLLTLTWELERGLDLGFFTLRFYSLLFAGGFILGYWLMKRIFAAEGIAQEKLDTLLTYVVIATVVGARLGHVFFYQWDYYSQNPIEIFKVWEGGLASHGAAIAIIIALYFYSKNVLKKPLLYILDRVVLTVALAACLIRLGNFANSEIYGEIANSSVQTVFAKPAEDRLLRGYPQFLQSVALQPLEEEMITDSIIYPLYNLSFEFTPAVKDSLFVQDLISKHIAPYLRDANTEDKNLLITSTKIKWQKGSPNRATVQAAGVPRRPTQLYEAFAYLMIFFILMRVFQDKNLAQRQGLIFGLFLILLFGFRFFIEFYKENQVSRESGMQLNMGQWLSIPLVGIGLLFAIIAKRKNDESR
jgi:prolipoprotein diacylglyceryl transferase